MSTERKQINFHNIFQVKCNKKCLLAQHKQTAIHCKNWKGKTANQLPLAKVEITDKNKYQFCSALQWYSQIYYGISWRILFSIISSQKIPNESTLRKNYLNPTYLSVNFCFHVNLLISLKYILHENIIFGIHSKLLS